MADTAVPATSEINPVPARGQYWKWWVCGLLLLATMLNYMDRVTLNVLSPRILKELELNKQQYGELESTFAFAFATGAILFGWLVDRINVRWLYPIVLLAWSAAGFFTGLVESFVMLWLCRFWLGLCEAGHWPCALKTTQHILPREQRSLGNGILQSGAALGAIITPQIIKLMVPSEYRSLPVLGASVAGLFESLMGQGPFQAITSLFVETPEPGLWRLPFLVIGGIGSLWAVGWLLSVRKSDLQTQPRPSGVSLMSILTFLLGLLGFDLLCRLVIANPDWLPGDALQGFVKEKFVPLAVKGLVFLAAVVAVLAWLRKATAGETHMPRPVFFRRFFVLMALVVAINLTWHFFRVWLPLFLVEERDYRQAEMADFITGYYICADLGSLTIGFATLGLVRRGLTTHGSRVVTFGACSLVCLLGATVSFIPSGPFLVGLLFVFGFAALGLFPNYYSFSQELTTVNQGKVTGALGCITWMAQYFLQDLFGQLIQASQSYAFGLALAGLAPLAAVVVLLLFWGKDHR